MREQNLPAFRGPRIGPARRADPEAVRRHLDSLTKPRGSLGRVEELAAQLAQIYGDPPPPFHHRVIFVLAADHGVVRHGVSAYPAAVTAQMCRNYARGGAAISVFGRVVRAEVVAVDVGVDIDPADLPGVTSRKVRRGSRDLAEGPALSREEVIRAIEIGIELVRDRSPVPDLVGLGEMGIGNTTSAAAVTCALTGVAAERVVGPGTGVDSAGLARKREIIRRAVFRLQGATDPVRVLAEVGGLEIAALVGVVLGAAAEGRAVVSDGFITTAAALAAVRIDPAAADYLIASHCSTEPGHSVQLDALGLHPLLQLEMRLGEGTGAALAFPLVEAAAAILREMATFESAGVSVARRRPADPCTST